MKKLAIFALLCALCLVMAPALVSAHTEEDPYSEILYAGQDIAVGAVKVWNDADNLYVKYQIDPGWVLLEAHLAVYDDCDDIPKTTKGNPIPGQFPYTMPAGYASEYVETISLDYFDVGDVLCIAAHAKVARQILYGLSLGTGEAGTSEEGDIIYAIDVAAQSATAIYDTGLDLTNPNWPNGIAYDEANNKLYYATAGSPSQLYAYDFATMAQSFVGALTGANASGSFYDGKYYYVENGQGDLWEVSFPFAKSEIATDFGAGNANYGDIAIDPDGIMYGSTTGGSPIFYKLNLDGFAYNLIYGGTDPLKAVKLQLAFGKDGRLYGQRARTIAGDAVDGNFYVVNMSNGDLTLIGQVYIDGDQETYPDPVVFTDIAAGRVDMETEETAWGDGVPFGGKTWATKFTYTVQEENGD